MELKIIIKDRSIDGLKLALEAITQNLSQANHKAVETPHGYWKYMISGGPSYACHSIEKLSQKHPR